MIRRFELVDYSENHNKFWTIQKDGTNVFVTFGRRGTKGATQVKQFSSDWSANEFIREKIKEKTNKGYDEVFVGSDVAEKAPPPTPPKPKSPVKITVPAKEDDLSVIVHGRAKRSID
jgi:predicted DNA-binding WGR domain protein